MTDGEKLDMLLEKIEAMEESKSIEAAADERHCRIESHG